MPARYRAARGAGFAVVLPQAGRVLSLGFEPGVTGDTPAVRRRIECRIRPFLDQWRHHAIFGQADL